MFALTHGMEWMEWSALDPDERAMKQKEISREMVPILAPSDDSSDEAVEDMWEGWVSGEVQRDTVRSSGFWPDGAAVGSGHGSPYLQPIFAHAIRSKAKRVEGRPRDGVSTAV